MYSNVFVTYELSSVSTVARRSKRAEKMYKKTLCTCKAVVLLIKPIAFFDAQSLQKQAKQTGVSCCWGKHCWFTLCFVLRIWGVCTPSKHQETTKQTKTINKNKNQEPCQNESFASRYFFPFPLNTEPGPRLPSWKCVPQPFRARSPAQSQSGE